MDRLSASCYDTPSEALAHYTKFLEYWKDAEPGLPELIDAKARAAELAHSPSRP